jgi:rubrerythrin
MVFCRSCEGSYNLKNPQIKKCPICKKEYKKTFQVLFV